MVEPIHLQDNLSKLPLTQKVNESARVAPEISKEHAAQQLKQQKNENANRTQESQESDKVKIQEKNRDKAGKKKRKKLMNLAKDEIEEKKDNIEPDPSGNLIDIVV